MSLARADIEALVARCWRSPVEFCRIVLPTWFPRKMPWVHRGLLALWTGHADFLLDFGTEEWGTGAKREFAEWTPADLDKIVSNFVVKADPANRDSPFVPLFRVQRDADGGAVAIEFATAHLSAAVIPRGFSKTTLVNALNLRDILYRVRKFILYVSESAPHAQRQLSSVRGQMESNEMIRLVWGNLVPERMASNKWTDAYIEPLNGVKAGALGRGGQIRGISKDAIRPDRIILDDIDDDESVKNPELRADTMRWFVSTVQPALLDMGDERGDIIVIGTILHPEAFLPQLELDEDFIYLRFAAVDREGDMLWPLKMDTLKLERTKRAAAAKGQLDSFYLEYMSAVHSNDNTPFPQGNFTYVARAPLEFAALALVCDPAISEKRQADMCGFAVAGILPGGLVHCLDSFGRVGMSVDEQVDKFFELHFKYAVGRDPRTFYHGIEAIAYQRALVSAVTARMYQESQKHGQSAFFDIAAITHGKTAKDERVLGILRPRFISGWLTFQQHFPDLEMQMIEWPRARKDLPDCLAMAVGLLDPYAQLNAGPTYDPTADTLPPLEAVGEGYWGAP